jgi:phosphatidylinositol alpha-mannosyltransferase
VKIGIVTPNYYPYPGGVTEHVHHTCLELKRLGHEVRVITSRFGKGETPDEEDVIRVGRSITVPANGSLSPLPLGSRLGARLARVFARERFDVLHVHEPLMPMLCLAAVRAARAPVVGTFHSNREKPVGYRVFHRAFEPYAAKLAKRIAVSTAARDTIQGPLGGTYEIIPNGVDVGRFSTAAPIPELLDGKLNILFVGRMDPRKGAKHLLRALPAIRSELPVSRVTFVGGGPLSWYYRSYVPRSCGDYALFEGRVSAGMLPRYYATADIYCSPATRGESFGIVLLEAMAAGAATVASDIPGYRDVVTHGETGILVAPGRPSAIADAIVRLGRDENLRASLVANGRRAVERYSWDTITREILAVYEEAVSGERSGRSVRGDEPGQKPRAVDAPIGVGSAT